MNDKNLCYSCARGKVCRENPAFPGKECAGYVAEQKWISVKDRLPEDDGLVLVLFTDRYMNIRFKDTYTLANFDNDDGWILEIYPEFENPNVTHWMPLPEPPATVSTKSE